MNDSFIVRSLQQFIDTCENAVEAVWGSCTLPVMSSCEYIINHVFFLQLLDGSQSQILESDWLIARALAVRIFPSGPRVRTALKFPTLATFCYTIKERKM